MNVSVFLDGSVRAAAEDTKGTSVATGALGLQFGNRFWRMATLLNIAAKRDTIRSAPGQSLLVPGSGGFSSGLVEAQFRISDRRGAAEGNTLNLGFLGERLSVRSYVGISSAIWELPAEGDIAAEAVSANVGAFGAGLSYEVLKGRIGADSTAPTVSGAFDVGFAHRRVYGDVVQSGLEERRTAFLGVSDRRFSGVELGFRLQFNTIKGSLVYYHLGDSKDGSGVRGLTGGQVAAGFSLAAPIISGTLR